MGIDGALVDQLFKLFGLGAAPLIACLVLGKLLLDARKAEQTLRDDFAKRAEDMTEKYHAALSAGTDATRTMATALQNTTNTVTLLADRFNRAQP